MKFQMSAIMVLTAAFRPCCKQGISYKEHLRIPLPRLSRILSGGWNFPKGMVTLEACIVTLGLECCIIGICMGFRVLYHCAVSSFVY